MPSGGGGGGNRLGPAPVSLHRRRPAFFAGPSPRPRRLFVSRGAAPPAPGTHAPSRAARGGRTPGIVPGAGTGRGRRLRLLCSWSGGPQAPRVARRSLTLRGQERREPPRSLARSLRHARQGRSLRAPSRRRRRRRGVPPLFVKRRPAKWEAEAEASAGGRAGGRRRRRAAPGRGAGGSNAARGARSLPRRRPTRLRRRRAVPRPRWRRMRKGSAPTPPRLPPLRGWLGGVAHRREGDAPRLPEARAPRHAAARAARSTAVRPTDARARPQRARAGRDSRGRGPGVSTHATAEHRGVVTSRARRGGRGNVMTSRARRVWGWRGHRVAAGLALGLERRGSSASFSISDLFVRPPSASLFPSQSLALRPCSSHAFVSNPERAFPSLLFPLDWQPPPPPPPSSAPGPARNLLRARKKKKTSAARLARGYARSLRPLPSLPPRFGAQRRWQGSVGPDHPPLQAPVRKIPGKGLFPQRVVIGQAPNVNSP